MELFTMSVLPLFKYIDKLLPQLHTVTSEKSY